MDGMVQNYARTSPVMQQTLKTAIDCVGVGLHSGRKVRLSLHPAEADSGIVFRLSEGGEAACVDVPARYDHVVDTRLCTVLGLPNRSDIRIGTVEHLLAALAGSGITNVLAVLDGPEVPVLDGSAEGFTFLIACAGVQVQDREARVIEVRRTVRVTQGESFAELRPTPIYQTPGFDASVSIDFAAPAIGRQALNLRLSPETFRAELARARTFTLAEEVEALQAGGLALGGSLDNAVVVDGDRVLNPGGLRMADEFVRHKLLDAVGDLALAGARLHGRLVSHRAGHALNNQLLRALFADDANWARVPAEGAGLMSGWNEQRVQLAAAPA